MSWSSTRRDWLRPTMRCAGLSSKRARRPAARSTLRRPWRALIQARKEAGLSQRDVADVMGVEQSAVAAFESQDDDPRLSTLRRYALAVGASVEHRVTTSCHTSFESEA